MKKFFKYIIAALVCAWIGYLVYNSLTEERPKPDPFGRTVQTEQQEEPDTVAEEEPAAEELSFNEVRRNVIELKENIKSDSTIVFQLAANDAPASVEWRTQDNATVVMWRSANGELYQLIAPIHKDWNPGPANTVLSFANGKKLRVLFEKSGELVDLGKKDVQMAATTQAAPQRPSSAERIKQRSGRLSKEERAARMAKVQAKREARRRARANN